ncbi:MAG: DNA methyltransferase [Methanoregula sp.]|jgi:adenine-specific DNA-methyltransferase
MPVSIPKVDLKSKSISEEQKEKLRQLFPEVFTEGKIDWERLQLTLGADVETGKERFGLTWRGKAECFRIIQEPSIGTLKPVKGESVDWDTTENLFIEGDNLETLKLLQKSYYGKVKMIYIDPPYNTGKEFIYPDKYSETLETYLLYTNQVDAEGKKFSTNPETSGRYHSNWLDMMYPRLFLARNLLRDDGAIFVSIDDHEVHNLRTLLNEIFGEENFIATIAWQKKYAPSSDDQGIANMHEYILVFSKSQEFQRGFLPRTDVQLNRYTNLDKDPRGDWASDNYLSNKSKAERPTLYYPIIHPKTGKEVWPPEHAVWRYSRLKHEIMVKENRLYWGPNLDYERPRLKRFKCELKAGMVPSTWWPHTDAGHNDEAKKHLAELMGAQSTFSNPKPVRLIKRLLQIGAPDDENIVLDFFGGACTTAHAVLELNKEDGNDRRFIMVQLPERIDEDSLAREAGYKTIADLGKERIRRAIKKITEEQNEAAKQKKLGEVTETPVDLGFRVFKLSKSNFKVWNGQVPANGKVEKKLEDFIENLHTDGTDEEILYELLLKSGFALTTPVAEKKIAGKKVYSIDDNALLICLEHDLTKDLIVKMAEIKPARAICLDTGFKNNDQLRTNAMEIMKSHGVADFRTV